ncbi:flavin-dependent dehydrogenase [Lutibacter sp. Hel_I_33_5]|uniref:NAD(P)/FAD-dependent oxidoreductase n=1 Tax=Lutibacter sp. Hel_I_33_5 TaxID=1566289 RepID=UPI0011A61DD1|nr:NAD(P)/FAD-dependent oxidoreductase [Lutibacter sp. Hel_I_33_5]TVZ55902.1 flavin-dependent dehydrogenase [Lutibacter sp. Hel_I_33_5]
MIKTAVCIVGSGPSGASTSLMLSKLKIHHYIVDKAEFPRDKTCGDGLILHAYKSLKTLGLLEAFLNDSNFIHSKKINLHINNKLKIQFKETEDRDMVISYGKRIHFDHFLVKELSEEYTTCEFGNAVRKFKEVPEGIIVTLKNGKEILTKVVVGADGIQSIVSKKLGSNIPDRKKTSTFISAYFKNVTDLPINNEAEIRLHYKKMSLFFYLFPLAHNEVNITLGGNTQKILNNDINLKNEILSILENHPKVAHKFKDAEQISSWRGWGIPNNYRNQKICGQRFLLVGDAAGLANSFYKEGVGTGMMSGIICANKIAECLQEDNFSAAFMLSYKKDIKQEFSRLLRFSELTLKLTKFKKLFEFIVSASKSIVEKRAYKMIQKRSY